MSNSPHSHGPTVVLKLDVPQLVVKELGSAPNTKAVKLLAEWAQDVADGRIAARRLRALKAGKTKATPWDQVKKELGL